MSTSAADTPYPIGLLRFQREVGAWADLTFTQSTKHSILAHLRREVEELSASAHLGPPEAEEEEAADCFLLLLRYAHRMDFSLLDAADRKFAANKLRQWGQPDAEGVVEHVRRGGDPMGRFDDYLDDRVAWAMDVPLDELQAKLAQQRREIGALCLQVVRYEDELVELRREVARLRAIAAQGPRQAPR